MCVSGAKRRSTGGDNFTITTTCLDVILIATSSADCFRNTCFQLWHLFICAVFSQLSTLFVPEGQLVLVLQIQDDKTQRADAGWGTVNVACEGSE